jgi:hypothetical protein
MVNSSSYIYYRRHRPDNRSALVENNGHLRRYRLPDFDNYLVA